MNTKRKIFLVISLVLVAAVLLSVMIIGASAATVSKTVKIDGKDYTVSVEDNTVAVLFAKPADGSDWTFINSYTTKVVDSGFGDARDLLTGALQNGTYKNGSVYLYMLKDYTVTRTSGWNDGYYLEGSFTLDLGGKTFTNTKSPRLFGFLVKNNSTKNCLEDSNITVINGTMATNQPIIKIFTEQGDTHYTGTKLVNATFENINFVSLANASKLFVADKGADNYYFSETMKAKLDIDIKNCTFNSTNSALTVATDLCPAGSVTFDTTITGTTFNLTSFAASNEIANTTSNPTAKIGNMSAEDKFSITFKEYNVTVTETYGDSDSLYFTSDKKFLTVVKKAGETEFSTKNIAGTLQTAMNTGKDKLATAAYQGGTAVVFMPFNTSYGFSNSGAGWNAAYQINGTLQIDLCGHTVTSTAPRIFGFQAQNNSFDSTIKLMNGTFKTSNVISEVWNEGVTLPGPKNCNLIFENLTMMPNGELASFTMVNAKTHDGGTFDATNNITFNVSFNNCTLNYANTVVTVANDAYADGLVNFNLSATGGSYTTELANNAKFLTYMTGKGSSDTVSFETPIVIPFGTAPTGTVMTTNGEKHLASIEVGNNVKYTPSNLYIEGYGYIPEYDADKNFAVFDVERNLHLGSYSAWADGAIERARKLNNPFGTSCDGLYAGKSVTILLRKDYTHTDSNYANYAHVTNIVFDLGGHTINQQSNYLFNFISKKTTVGTGTTMNETTTVVKNGTILTHGNAVVKINNKKGTGNFDYTGDKIFNIEFNGVTFDKYWAKNDKVETYAPLILSEIDGVLGVDLNATFNDCNITNCNGTMFDLTLSNPLKADVKINGGVINTNDMSTLNILSASDENDTLTFGKGTDGAYTSLVLPTSAAAPTASYNNGTLVFVKDVAGTETTTYILRDKSTENITYSPKISITLDRSLYLNVYIPTEDLIKFTFEGTEYADLAEAEGLLKTVSGKTYYVISTPFDSFEALDSLSLTVTVKAGDKNAVGTFSFSIPKYAKSVFASGTLVEKQVVRDVLSYIRAAYAYFKPEDTASIAIVDELIGKNYDVTAPVTPEGSGATNTPDLSGASLAVTAVPGIRFYITSDASAYSFYRIEGGNEIAIEATEGTDKEGSYLELDLYAYAMCDTVYYRIDGTEGGSYHIASYYEWAKTQNNPALVTIVERLWKYCQSARDYKNAVTVTFNYTDESGNALAEPKVVRKAPGAEVSFMSPAVSGYYTRDLYAYSSATANETVNVVYKPIPTSADEELVKEYLSNVSAWGDSITQGSSGNSGNTNAAKDHGIDLEALGSTVNGGTYSQILTNLISARLYSGFTVYNNGVGSETTATIACRANTKSYYFYIETAATLETSPIVLDLHQNKDLTLDGLREGVLRRNDNFGYIKNVYMTGKDESGNEVTVSGLLTCTAPEGYEKLNCAYELLTYTFTRTDGKTNKVTFDKDTRVVTQASIIFDGLTCIIFMGENGGYNKDNATIISQQEEILEACGNPEFFLIISSTSKTTADRKSLNDALTARWGRNYINMGNVLNSSRASYEYAGYSEEAIVAILDNIIEGSVTELLLTDACHPNAVGVAVMANAMFERLFELGAFDAILDYYDSLNA